MEPLAQSHSPTIEEEKQRMVVFLLLFDQGVGDSEPLPHPLCVYVHFIKGTESQDFYSPALFRQTKPLSQGNISKRSRLLIKII